MRIEPERRRELFAEERAEAAAVDPADDLANEPAEGDRVVAVDFAGLPERLLGGQQGGHLVPVVPVLLDDRLPDRGQPGRVVEQVAHRHVLLAACGELGPVLGDGRVDIEQALLDQAMGAERGQTLGRREDVDQRVAVPFALTLGCVPAAPEVHDRLAVQVDGDRRADVAVFGEVGGECVPDSVELGVVPAVNVDWGGGHGQPPSAS